MAASRQIKANFTAGELAPELLGRGDLRAYANGARRLRNVFIQPTGGVTRRPGLRHVASLPGPARLLAFEFNTEQTYLLVFTAGAFRVFLDDAQVAQGVGPWAGWQLPGLSFTQSADTLLVCHPDLPPQRLTRTSHTAWTLAGWNWVRAPTYRFAPADVTLTPGGSSGSVTVTASGPVFAAAQLHSAFRLRGRPATVTGVASATQATLTLAEDLPDTAASTDWEEGVFSGVRGFPVTACFHQDRLVIGGSRDLPNRLWLSRSGSLFDFDKGTGLDDQAIEFGLFSDQVNAIRAVFSGRHLQVFTTGGEWMVTGDPLTPSSIQLHRQTRIGSSPTRMIQPVDVDGSTIFAARSGRAIHEFAYTDVQQAYQSNDLGMVAQHLLRNPVSMAYDQAQRLLHVVMEDGGMATLTLFRQEEVTAWTLQQTNGAFRAVAELDGRVFVTVERGGSTRLERFEPGFGLDAALEGTSGAPQDRWSGLSHLEGSTVGILADGAPRDDALVSQGAVGIDPPAHAVQVGLRFTHEIEPLPPEMFTAAGARSAPLRLVSVGFRLLETSALDVDLGRGPSPVSFRRLDTPLLDAPPPRFSGDVRLSALGWRRDAMRPLWRIAGDAPLPLILLSVTTDMRTTD
ncbi:hypothetical protein EJV46_12190 [Roseococcus sp. SYP-B2431]|uniref:hypothetical protein n=1 Tax=Roseococcus sp. SYP-B2431 TaxID=2496640 RepID=UPI00103BDD3E|nr:hypothetical protein [Roseococcus sp. SYP-B2431]TCH97969.1 hypothetical protein EJV46_12190 [Roseococcus sp. SYP-B2431]